MEEILITFTEPIQKDGWNPDRATLIDLPSQRRVPTVTRWLTESILGIRPRAELESVSWYSLTVLIDGLKDWKLESVRDSALTIRFQTEDVYNTGTIEGRVIDDAPVDTAGTMFIVAAGSGREASRPVRTTAAADGSFTIRRLVPGQYTVHAFRDRNGDGVYDPGLPYPYRASERRSNESDTLKVRSRWPLEGVLLHLP
jgi:hypothetical protein